jgi:small GTP-binding protein
MILFSFFDNFGMEEINSEGSLNEDKEYNNSYKYEDDDIREFNVLLLGESDVGKSCILYKLVENKFEESQQSTIGVDYRTKKTTIGNQPINVKIWDSSGQEKFKTITKMFYKDKQLFILVYSVTDKDSFKSLENWLEDVKNTNTNTNAMFLLVGNKIDEEKERAVTKKEGEAFAEKHGMRFVEVSAKTGANISDALFSPFIEKFLGEEKKNEEIPGKDNERDVSSKSLNSSFCDKCCSCCSCFKKSEDFWID